VGPPTIKGVNSYFAVCAFSYLSTDLSLFFWLLAQYSFFGLVFEVFLFSIITALSGVFMGKITKLP